jgi:peptide-methionine (S)-S-oxide reductase
VWRTRAGYAGGMKSDPTYRSIGDHTECFEVDYDPAAVSYEDLLALFWQSHNPTRGAYSTQYASLILTHGEAQLASARASAENFEQAVGRKVLTRIEPLRRFYLAEGYHQKYRLRNDRQLMSEFSAMYPDEWEFVDSTAAARVNGYLDGEGSGARLVREIDGFGLTDEGRARLVARVGRSGGPGALL